MLIIGLMRHDFLDQEMHPTYKVLINGHYRILKKYYVRYYSDPGRSSVVWHQLLHCGPFLCHRIEVILKPNYKYGGNKGKDDEPEFDFMFVFWRQLMPLSVDLDVVFRKVRLWQPNYDTDEDDGQNDPRYEVNLVAQAHSLPIFDRIGLEPLTVKVAKQKTW